MRLFSLFLLLCFSVNIQAQDAQLLTITSPVGGCGLNQESVKIIIFNGGYGVIQPGFTASYMLASSGTIIEEVVNEAIYPSDSLIYTFSTPVDLNTETDTTFLLDVWLAVPGDTSSGNDFQSKSILSKVRPQPPADTSICSIVWMNAIVYSSHPDNLQIAWYQNLNSYPIAYGNSCMFNLTTDPTLLYLDAIGTNGCHSLKVCDTLRICNDTVYDLGIKSLLLPISGQGAMNNQVVKCSIQNFGNQSMSSFTVSYQINSGSISTEDFNGYILPGQSSEFEFSTLADLNGFGVAEFKLWITSTEDLFFQNDTLFQTISNALNSYCISAAIFPDQEDIGQVILNNLDHGTIDTVFNNPASTGTYSDFSVIGPVNLKKGRTYPITVKGFSSGGYHPCTVRVFADWNSDGYFAPNTETAITLVSDSTLVFTGNMTIPLDAVSGFSRMRIVLARDTGNFDIGPCSSPEYYFGETEDYQTRIVDDSITISGTVTYKNNNNTKMKKAIVSIYQNNVLMARDTTNSQGYYQFGVPAYSTYQIRVYKLNWWGGAAATDALMILRHFVGLSVITDLNLEAADVNASGSLNAVDGLFISKRFVGQINSFPAGDWIFEHPSVVIQDQDKVVNIKGLCFGDVNGSFQPMPY